MSLLQNEDFVLYQLRTAYLSSIKDGVGERLINVNSSVLNNPAFRAAGWVSNPADIKRTYSPPIPTAITSEYFQAPRSAALKAPEGFVDDEEEGGMVTGGGSHDTVGPALNAKRRRRKELLADEDDDSSDLSDESDDDEESQRPANQIKFTKMPLRTRSGSSPIQGSALRNELAEGSDKPSVTVTSPSRPTDNELRRGSLGTLETVKERPRRDTITSSEMSSENEFDNSAFRKRKVNTRKVANPLSQRTLDEEAQMQSTRLEALHEGDESDSTMSSEFSGSADSESLIGAGGDPLDSSPPGELPNMPGLSTFNLSPRKRKEAPQPTLQALPPPRPISFVLPVSALTQALRAKEHKPSNPLQRFAGWNAASEAQQNPIYLRIYCPFSAKPSKGLELLVRKFNDKGEGPSVAEAIGYALHRYQEEKLEPALAPEKMNVNCWVLRMYDDGEVDDEFPPLTRNKPLKDFASNNARGMRPRAREKPWDEFALVEASQREIGENEKLTPIYSREAAAALEVQEDASEGQEGLDGQEEKKPLKPIPSRAKSFRNPITGPSFAPTATRKDKTTLADAPTVNSSQAASRVGAPKTVIVHFTDESFHTKNIPVNCTTDTYIADVFEQVCHELRLDKALFILKVSGTTTVAPTDRTVEALGTRTDLDLQRRRFVGDGVFGLAGSPGSSSPNAPLIISTGGAPKKTKKGERVNAAVSGHGLIHPLAHRADASASALSSANYYRRFNVLRKQPMSFASSTSRILALDNEYIHIMPGETAKGAARPGGFAVEGGKTTTVHFSSVVGSKVSKKHPKMFRLIVYKERETKRYDFEARSADEAVEIVREFRRGVERYAAGVV